MTHAFPSPTAATGPDGQALPEDMDGQDYQMEMMKMLREVSREEAFPVRVGERWRSVSPTRVLVWFGLFFLHFSGMVLVELVA